VGCGVFDEEVMIEIKIEGIEDFKEFIRLIRRNNPDEKDIIRETKELNKASDDLLNAVDKNKGV